MTEVHFKNHGDMLRYPEYPTPPSTNEDSPVSIQMLPSPSYISDNSSSPVHFTQPQVVFLPPSNYTILAPNKTINMQAGTGKTEEGSPFLKMVEQPLDKFRFRYKSEMTGTHGSLNGENSDKTRKMTYPTVELCNYEGTAIIRCSIWQVNHNKNDFMPHAHRLVKKRFGKEEPDDPHDVKVDKNSNYQATFHSMGIIHTAKKNIVAELIKKKTKLKKEAILRENRKELNKKEEMEIKGLAEAESKSINLNVVCLRFDAFLVGVNDVYFPLCPPIYSHAINNLKSALTGELKIVRLDHCTSPANGGREIFLLVERVTKKNIKVRFYELDDEDLVVWEDYGKFNDLDVHHQYAIVLKTPPYKNKDINSQVKVFVELVRPSDNARSEPKEFTYIPMQNRGRPGTKRSRPNEYDLSDYDTLSIGSENLPTTINLSNELDYMSLTADVDSEELQKAMKNFDSDEFNKIFEKFGKEYESADIMGSLSFDAPAGRSVLRRKIYRNPKIKPYHNSEFTGKVQRVYQEISEFLRTSPNLEGIKRMMRHYLADFKDEFNAFHMAVMINNTKVINFFVKLIFYTHEFDLVNVQSQKQGTVLHLSTLYNNLDLIRTLISTCNADVSKVDADLNTPLHLAVSDSEGCLMEELLKSKYVNNCINSENGNNYTPLHLAVQKKNLKAVQFLCQKGADIDYRHPCNGFTPLRFAVENGDINMVNFILYETNVNPKVRDFSELDPLQVALHGSTQQDIKHVVEQYIAENRLPFEEINIKEEPDDLSSEDEMVIAEEVKIEPLAIHDDVLYQNVTRFTDECLEQVSKLLDASGKWQELAVLLDIEHLLRMQTFDERKSPSKQLLNYVVASNGGSIKEIRDFLENLDELQAVQIIDRMADEVNGYNS